MYSEGNDQFVLYSACKVLTRLVNTQVSEPENLYITYVYVHI